MSCLSCSLLYRKLRQKTNTFFRVNPKLRRLSMTEERKHAILLATVISTARRLQPLLEADDEAGKPNMGTEFWAAVYTKKSIDRAAHILNLIDAKWPAP